MSPPFFERGVGGGITKHGLHFPALPKPSEVWNISSRGVTHSLSGPWGHLSTTIVEGTNLPMAHPCLTNPGDLLLNESPKK